MDAFDIVLTRHGFHDTFGKKIDDEELICFWTYPFYVSKDSPTLKELFLIMKRNPIFLSMVEKMKGGLLEPYISELFVEPKKVSEFSHLEISKEFHVSKALGEADRVNVYMQNCFSGILNEERFSLQFTPVSEIKDLKIKLKENSTVFYNNHNNSYEVKGEEQKLCNNKICFGEAIMTILNEITFFNSPEDRDEKIVELKQIMDDVKSGETEWVSSDEFFAEIKSRYNKDDDLD